MKGGDNMVYKWKTEACIKADANAAGKQFEELERTVGLTAKSVLNANRAEGTPLHNEFEWNDSTAAENYREIQAAKMIRAICVDVETSENEVVPVRAFFRTQESAGYESLQVIVKNSDKRAELLATALKEMNAFIRKYEILKELKPVIEAVEKVSKELKEKSA